MTTTEAETVALFARVNGMTTDQYRAWQQAEDEEDQ